MNMVAFEHLKSFGLPVAGVAEILEVNRSMVVFRYAIDETEPETIIMAITRERWAAMGFPAHLVLSADR